MPTPRSLVRRAPRRGPLLVGLVGLALVLASCADDGRTLREPSPDQTTTTEAAASSTSDAGEQLVPGAVPGPDGFVVRIDGALPGDPLPNELTCAGADQAPVLTWQNVPDDAAELAVAMVDRDADDRVHWLVVGVDPGLAGIDGSDLPPGASSLLNDEGSTGWSGPCPPDGATHDYVLTLYALGAPTSFDPLVAPAEAINRLAGASVATTSVAGTTTGGS